MGACLLRFKIVRIPSPASRELPLSLRGALRMRIPTRQEPPSAVARRRPPAGGLPHQCEHWFAITGGQCCRRSADSLRSSLRVDLSASLRSAPPLIAGEATGEADSLRSSLRVDLSARHLCPPTSLSAALISLCPPLPLSLRDISLRRRESSRRGESSLTKGRQRGTGDAVRRAGTAIRKMGDCTCGADMVLYSKSLGEA